MTKYDSFAWHRRLRHFNYGGGISPTEIDFRTKKFLQCATFQHSSHLSQIVYICTVYRLPILTLHNSGEV